MACMGFLPELVLLMSVLNVILAFILFLHSKKTLPDFFFSLLTLNVGFWSLAIYLLISPHIGFEIFKFGVMAHYWAGNLIFLSFFWFVLYYEKEKRTFSFTLPVLVSMADIAILCILTFSNFIFKSIEQTGVLATSLNFNPDGYNFYTIFLSGLFILSEIILYLNFRSSNGLKKKHLGYIFLGTFIAGLLGQTTNLILPAFGIFFGFSIGPVLSTIFIGIIGYAILRHGLFNLKIIATEIFTVLLVLTVAADIFSPQLRNELLLGSLFFLLVLLFCYFLIRSVYQEVRTKEKIENLAQSLEAANTELKRLDRAKSEFISIASHQLRTPLTIIKGYLSMIREGNYGVISQDIATTVNKMYLSNERLIKLVNDLLDLSRMESGRMKYEFAEMDLEEVVDSTVDEFQLPAKDKNIHFIWKKDDKGFPKIWGDAWKLRQVVFNLIDNALKYNREGDIEIKLEKEDDSLKLSVQDSGIGMTEETINNIFQKFSRGRDSAVAKVNAVGVGLGLYIAKRIVDDHGGEIGVTSPGEGKGSTFFIRLPLASEKNKEDLQFKQFTTNA